MVIVPLKKNEKIKRDEQQRRQFLKKNMDRREQGYLLAATALAKNGLIDDFVYFVENCSEKIDILKVVSMCLPEKECLEHEIIDIVEYFLSRGGNLADYKQILLSGAITVRRTQFIKYLLQVVNTQWTSTFSSDNEIIPNEDNFHSVFDACNSCNLSSLPYKIDAILEVLEIMIDLFLSANTMENFQKIDLERLYSYNIARKKDYDRILELFIWKGYDITHFTFPRNQCLTFYARHYDPLVKFGVDFTTNKWSKYLLKFIEIEYFLYNNFIFRQTLFRLKKLFELGVRLEPVAEELLFKISYHDMFENKDAIENGKYYVIVSKRKKVVKGIDRQQKTKEDQHLRLTTYPVEILDILEQNGLDLSNHTVIHYRNKSQFQETIRNADLHKSLIITSTCKEK